MVLLAYCSPCQYGDHEHHYEVVQAVPEGMIDGVRCDCKGECIEEAANRKPDPIIEAMADLIGMPEGWPSAPPPQSHA